MLQGFYSTRKIQELPSNQDHADTESFASSTASLGSDQFLMRSVAGAQSTTSAGAAGTSTDGEQSVIADRLAKQEASHAAVEAAALTFEKSKKDVVLHPGSKFSVAAADVCAQLRFDLGKHSFEAGRYKEAASHFGMAREHYSGATTPTKLKSAKASLVAGSHPSQRYLHFTPAELRAFEIACVGLGHGSCAGDAAPASKKRKKKGAAPAAIDEGADAELATAIALHRDGKPSSIGRIASSNATTHQGDAAGNDGSDLNNATKYGLRAHVSRSTVPAALESWTTLVQLTVDDVAGDGGSSVPTNLFWSTIERNVESFAHVDALLSACEHAIANCGNEGGDLAAVAAAGRIQRLAARVWSRINRSSSTRMNVLAPRVVALLAERRAEAATNSGGSKGSEVVGGDMIGRVWQEKTAALKAVVCASAAQASSSGASTDQERELELERSLVPETIQKLSGSPADAAQHLISKAQRLRASGGAHGCRKALTLLDAAARESKRISSSAAATNAAADARMERLITLTCLAGHGAATAEETVALDTSLRAAVPPDGQMLEILAAHILNRSSTTQSFVAARELAMQWCVKTTGRSKQICALLLDLTVACSAVLDAEAMAASAPAGSGAGASSAQMSQLQNAVAPLCQNIVGLIQNPAALVSSGSSKRKRNASHGGVEAASSSSSGWDCALGLIAQLTNKVAVKTLVSALTIAYNRAQTNAANRISVSRYGIAADVFRPIATSLAVRDSGSAGCTAVFRSALRDAMRVALKADPAESAYYFAFADICHAYGDHLLAVQRYLDAFRQVSGFYQLQISPIHFGQKTLSRMVSCLMRLNAHIQAAALCQYCRPIDYTTAFRAVSQACGGAKLAGPASEVYFRFIWSTNILEVLMQVHKQFGDARKLGVIRTLIGRQEFNEATDTRTRSRAIESSRQELMSALAREFC